MIGITGGAGFLGSHLVDALAGKGRRVRVLDDLSGLDRAEASRRLAQLSGWGEQVELVRGSLDDAAASRRFFTGLERVYHFARVPRGGWMGDQTRAYEREIRNTWALLDGLERCGVDHLVLRSDASVYGETPSAGAGPQTPLMPNSRRGAARVAVEALASSWHATGHRQLTIARTFEVYGPRMGEAHLVRRCLTAALDESPLALPGDQGVRRDFVYAGDAVRVLLQARRVRSDRPAVFVIGSGRPVSLLDLVAAVRRVSGRAPRLGVGPSSRDEPRHSVGDPRSTRERLHVEADTPLDAGLEQTLAWLVR